MATLVIVESPAKAKTISRILGKGYVVEASYGHVRDLPESAEEIPAKVKKEKWARLGVDVENDFQPLYVVPSDKKKYVKRLKDAAKDADELLLATDEDREGESISWHVLQVLKPKVPVRRIAFHEITSDAIKAALEDPREIDENMVKAQESRRILDRLYGYLLSPVLWKKVRRGLSAGRVQSVAVRLCVMRERERRVFVAAPYWDAEAELEKDGSRFTAKLARIDGKRIAGGQDFEQTTGKLKKDTDVHWISSELDAEALIASFGVPFTVAKTETKPITQRPSPPFTTSSMQQEANRKLGFSAAQTMRIAQRLYEGIDIDGERIGLITYMRTDSVTLSSKALTDAEVAIKDMYGNDFTTGPRVYKTKAANAQEAHEAIRPTEISRTPDSVAKGLDKDALRLYELIWKRTIASQMADARLLRTSVEIEAKIEDESVKKALAAAGVPTDAAMFTTSGKQIAFPGYLRAYVEGSDDPDAEIADKEVILPNLEEGDSLPPVSIEAKAHETLPPARYTEASLVKKLEAEGIGRPSTYASIIETIQRRTYVFKKGNALVPTITAFCVTKLLETHFSDYVDIGFTANLERELDEISNGELDHLAHLDHFYRGNGSGEPGLEKRIATEEPQIEYPAFELGTHPETGEPVVAKVGRYGPYVQVGGNENGDRLIASLPNEIPPADLTVEMAVEIVKKKQEGPKIVGTCPETGNRVYVLHGRFGPYVQLGENPEGKKDPKPKRASLPKELAEDDIDLDMALKLLSLPRTLGTHPESNEPVVAAKGRFGPYIKCGDDTRSLRGKDDDVYTISLSRAIEILAQPKQSRGRRAPTKKVLKDLGKDKATGLGIEVLEGPYGAYITNGELNAKLPEGTSAEAITIEEAAQILAEYGKAPKRRKKKSA